jgi:hypothetical protein
VGHDKASTSRPWRITSSRLAIAVGVRCIPIHSVADWVAALRCWPFVLKGAAKKATIVKGLERAGGVARKMVRRTGVPIFGQKATRRKRDGYHHHSARTIIPTDDDFAASL